MGVKTDNKVPNLLQLFKMSGNSAILELFQNDKTTLPKIQNFQKKSYVNVYLQLSDISIFPE